MNRSIAFGVMLLAVLGCSSSARAHEFWIMPTSFAPAPLSQVGFELRVGTGWPGETVPRDDDRIVRFALIDPRGEHPINGEPVSDPAGYAAATALGPAIAIYRSSPASITLAAEKFEAYLKQEGLERISRIRAERGQSAADGKEIYSRCAKALLQVGGRKAPPGGFNRVTGLTLELIPQSDPATLTIGGDLTVQLRYKGEPLAGALVRAQAQDRPNDKIELRTDAAGRVSFPLRYYGVWLLSAVQMIEAPKESGADWESLWASLTFSLSEPPR